MNVSRFSLTIFALTVFSLVGTGIERAYAETWVGQCYCNVSSPVVQCHINVNISAPSAGEVRKRCAQMTHGRGYILRIHKQ
jgi:hypothetical protein